MEHKRSVMKLHLLLWVKGFLIFFGGGGFMNCDLRSIFGFSFMNLRNLFIYLYNKNFPNYFLLTEVPI